MKALLTALTLVLSVAGCSHGQVQLNAGAGASSASGTVITSSTSGVNAQAGGSTAALLLSIGLAAAIASRDDMAYGTRYTANPFMAVTDTPRAPAMAQDRRINEQDCTKPIDLTAGNLRCK